MASAAAVGSLGAGKLELSPLLAGTPLPQPAQGRLVGIVPFLGERDSDKLGLITGYGLEGRRSLDLSKLQPDRLVVSNRDFFIRTLEPDGIDRSGPWKLSIGGQSARPVQLDALGLARDSRRQGVFLTECSGNGPGRAFGLISAAKWSGVPISKLLNELSVPADCERLLIAGADQHSRPSRDSRRGAGWSFPISQLEDSGAFLATDMNGAALPAHHGHPLRLVVPGWYGCCWIKWVDRIVFQGEDAPASGQMEEFAGRTHQDGVPALARDYRPSVIDQAAMPVRVEEWSLPSGTFYRIVGVSWGGDVPTGRLQIKLGKGVRWAPVQDHPQTQNQTWTLWTHTWRPSAPGLYRIRLRVHDPEIRTRRLDRHYYTRYVRL